jgi:hypothetical protein
VRAQNYAFILYRVAAMGWANTCSGCHCGKALDGKAKYCYEEGMAKRRRAPISTDPLSAAASLLGRLGGEARAKLLTPERRIEIARMGARKGAIARIVKLGQTPRTEAMREAVQAAKAKRNGKAKGKAAPR